MNAVLMAGGSAKDRFTEDILYKSLAPILGKPMVRWVAEAFLASDRVGEICVVGPQAELTEALMGLERVTVLEGTPEMVENMFLGLEHFAQDEKVMMATADIPMISGEMITFLSDAFEALDAGMIYPIISREDTQRRFPDMKRTYLKVVGGEYTGGNIVCLNPAQVMPKKEFVKDMLAKRKHPAKLAAMLGPKILYNAVRGKLKIEDAEKKALDILGLVCRAMVCPYPEIGSDVDHQEDIAIAERELSKA